MPVNLSVLFQTILTHGLSEKNVSYNGTIAIDSENSLFFKINNLVKSASSTSNFHSWMQISATFILFDTHFVK